MRQGGFALFDGLVSPEVRDRWLSEALVRARRARRALVREVAGLNDDDADDEVPLQRRRSAIGGEVQEAIYHSRWMVRFLRKLTGVSPTPNSRFGGYIYYTRTGDHVGIHRDDETCEVVAITCLCDGPQGGPEGGAFCVYPSRLSEPVAAIEAAPERGVVRLRLRPGQTLVMFGRIVPHSVLPVTDGQRRVVSALCYQIDGRAMTARHAAPRDRT